MSTAAFTVYFVVGLILTIIIYYILYRDIKKHRGE